MCGEFLRGLTAPIGAVSNPTAYYEKLRLMLLERGSRATAIVYVGAWVASSVIAYTLLLAVEMTRSLSSLSLAALIGSPLRATLYAFAFPLIPAGLDAVVIMCISAPLPRAAPLKGVLAVRASSLLPYTLRVVLLDYRGSLTVEGLLLVGHSPLELALLLAGSLLTVIGLRRTLGTSWLAAAAGGLAPLTLKALIEVMRG